MSECVPSVRKPSLLHFWKKVKSKRWKSNKSANTTLSHVATLRYKGAILVEHFPAMLQSSVSFLFEGYLCQVSFLIHNHKIKVLSASPSNHLKLLHHGHWLFCFKPNKQQEMKKQPEVWPKFQTNLSLSLSSQKSQHEINVWLQHPMSRLCCVTV